MAEATSKVLFFLLFGLSAAAFEEANVAYSGETLREVLEERLMGVDVGFTNISEIYFQDASVAETEVFFEAYIDPRLDVSVAMIIVSSCDFLFHINRRKGEVFVFRKPQIKAIDIVFRSKSSLGGRDYESISSITLRDKVAIDLLPISILMRVQFNMVPRVFDESLEQVPDGIESVITISTENANYAFMIPESVGNFNKQGKEDFDGEAFNDFLEFSKYFPAYYNEMRAMNQGDQGFEN